MDAVSYAKASTAYKLAKQVETSLGGKVDLDGSSIVVPVGTTATRPILGVGESAIRYNSDVGGLEEWNGSEWRNVSASISAVNLKGTDTEANILAMVGMVAEDLWIASDTLHGWVYDGSVWIDVGPLQGPQGVQGVAGKSAYTVAVEGGFVGTEVQWLASLVGPTGTTGNGIASVVKTGTVGLVDTYTVTMTNGSTAEFTVTNGVDGVDGNDVDHIAQTSGTGAAGTVDVYTVWGDVAETVNLGTFNVYNGADGTSVVVNDSVTNNTETWSSNKISGELDTKVAKPVTSTANRVVKFSDTNGNIVDSNLVSNNGGDLGLGVSPSVWHDSVRALETASGAVFNQSGTALRMIQNGYYSVGSFYERKDTAPATLYSQENGEHKWATATSGTAGTTITFNEKMKLDNAGALTVGGVEVVKADGVKTINGQSILGTGDIDVSTGTGISSNEFVATADQTVFTVTYSVGNLEVYRNGLLLAVSDYTATDGTSVILNVGAVVNDIINVKTYDTFDIANTYTKAEIDSKDSLKQDTLVSGTNIKTVNGESIVGSGNLVIQGFTLAEAQAVALCF